MACSEVAVRDRIVRLDQAVAHIAAAEVLVLTY